MLSQQTKIYYGSMLFTICQALQCHLIPMPAQTQSNENKLA